MSRCMYFLLFLWAYSIATVPNLANSGIKYQPQLVIAEFLNHQQYVNLSEGIIFLQFSRTSTTHFVLSPGMDS